MALGTVLDPTGAEDACTEAGRLADIAATEAGLTRLRIAQVVAIAAWAEHHVVRSGEDACTLTERGLDTGLPVAGEGAPLISDFAVTELAATLGRSLDSGRHYVGQVVELAHRLPRTWRRVTAGEVATWKGLRIADLTRPLPAVAAAYVDRHLAPVAHGCSWAQIDRLLDAALTRFDPDAAQQRRRDAAERRRLDIHLDQAGTAGTVGIDGVLDTADALDLEAVIGTRARELADLGCADALDVRRSRALGDLARADQPLDLGAPDTRERPRTGRRARRSRTVVLHVHLTEAALTGGGAVARLEETRAPVTVDQVRAWCGSAGTILVRPVLDLAACAPVDAYEIPQRLHDQVRMRNTRCVFPHCTRHATRCDSDHVIPHAGGGSTCPCNLAPLCRGHHRAKTHGGWTYATQSPGTFIWRDPHGQAWLTDPIGTRPP
ncbi:HNH endonuclease signature motif containing protein [Nocardioides sambongensis]|uniref:HNH endonuclease signature motif containing protein n=1 Tax=Nocardioides sambongensis TaxID=2589074 RepID=UPI0018C8A224|nr:HNH endonuclease signature motif containing protein [Nocardioides sambongensis]